MVKRAAMMIAMLAALSSVALAQGRRPDARTIDCEQVQSMIISRGAVVLTTGQHTYDRYVADGRYCSMGEVALYQTIRTRDTRQCVVYACRIDPYGPFDR